MNSHTEIQKRLAAYCSGDVDAGERTEIEGHLATCPRCRADLADLATTLKLIRSVPEVEAPSWMKSRIMAHLREEQTTRQQWFRRDWFPLHTGFPVKALALLIVCVSGYYLSRSVDSELQMTKLQKVQENPAQQAPTSTSAPAPAKPAAVIEKSGHPAQEQPQKAAAPAATPQQAPRQENLPVQPSLQTKTAPAPYAPVPPVIRDQYGGKAESMRTTPAAESSSHVTEAAPELKKKNRNLERNLAASGQAFEAAPTRTLPQAMVRLSVADPSAAVSQIREAALRSGGKILEEPEPSGHLLKLRIPAARQGELLVRLQQLGRIVDHAAPPEGARLLEMTIKW